MDLQVVLSAQLEHQINLPKSFLNYLLENNYNFEEGILCLKLTSVFSSCYVCMNEFTQDNDKVAISYSVNSLLNTVDNDYIHIDIVEPVKCDMVQIRGHRDSFGKIQNIKEKLEILFTRVKIINKGMVLMIDGLNGPESFTIVDLLDDATNTIDWFLSMDTEVKIDFLQTSESIEREKKEKERKELEARGYIGEGKRLGGTNFDKEKWLKKLSGNTY